MMGKTFQRPVRLMICPEVVEAISSPATIGSMCTPDRVGLTPCTICRNVGRYVIAPNIAKPTMKLISATSVNVRTRNSRSGSTGSAAPRSTRTNTASRTRPMTASPMIWAEPQAQVVPPSEATSTRQVATVAIRRVPR